MKHRITGIYKQDRPDFGRITDDAGISYFVSGYHRNGALPGDLVEAFITKEATETMSAEVRVWRIFSRTRELLYGRIFESRKNRSLLVVLDIPDGERIRLKYGKEKGARKGDMVSVIVHGIGKEMLASVVERLGDANDFAVEREIAIKKSGLMVPFPTKVLEEADALLKHRDSAPNRKDKTHDVIITIDGEDAKDLDDAIWVRSLENGNFELSVHIADVAEYVRENSTLDREGLRRGNSTYLSDRVIPMLPEVLSNHLCSLNPDAPKLCLAISMEIDPSGKVVKSHFYESVIHSRARTTYNQVESWHLRDGEYPLPESDILEMIDRAYKLADWVDARRAKEWKIELELEETKVRLDERKEPVEIVVRERKASHRLIETFMILANEEIGKFFAKNKIPFVYRIHEAPSETGEAEIRALFANYGISVSPGILTPKIFRDAYEKLLALPDMPPIEKTLLSKLQKAIYSEKPLGHYGLALEYYSHFTSPIRRYSDLQIHRIIKEFLRKQLDNARMWHYRKLLPIVAKAVSDTERASESLERDIRDLEIIRFLESHVGEIRDGIVTGASKYAFYVRIENGVEWAIFLGKPKAGSEHEFPPFGTKVRVRIEKADRVFRRLDFSVVE